MARQKDADELRLKRERAGRYVTADGRFAVEGDAAGAWYMIDAERLDGLGLPLVRGPYPSLDAARDAVGEASRAPVDSPPAPGPTPTPIVEGRKARVARGTAAPAPVAPPKPPAAKPTAKRAAEPPAAKPIAKPAAQPAAPAHGKGGHDRPAPQDASDDEPAWMARLPPEERANARRLGALLERAGIDDPGLVRREIEANLPDVARALLAHSVKRDALDPWAGGSTAIEELGAEAPAAGGRPPSAGGSKRPTAGARDARTRAARAAVRRLLARAEPDDLAMLAWLVALQTSARIFASLGTEGRDAGQGLRGWRLIELGPGRAPSGRTVAIDEPDLLSE